MFIEWKKNFNSLVVVFAGSLSVTCISNYATSAPITYFGEDLNGSGSGRVTVSGSNSEAARNSFLSNLVGVGTENFESFSGGTGCNTGDGGQGMPLGLNFPGSSGSISATISGTGEIDSCSSGTSGGGRYPTSGNNYLSTASGTANFSIVFSSGISAFGFYGTDAGDFDGQLTLTLAGGGNTVLNIGNTLNSPNASLLFFGFIDPVSSYTSIAFNSTSSDDFFGFDDMTIGDPQQIRPVPEPGSLGILVLGLAGLGLVKRKKL